MDGLRIDADARRRFLPRQPTDEVRDVSLEIAARGGAPSS